MLRPTAMPFQLLFDIVRMLTDEPVRINTSMSFVGARLDDGAGQNQVTVNSLHLREIGLSETEFSCPVQVGVPI